MNIYSFFCFFCKKNKKIPHAGNKKLQLLIINESLYLSIRNQLSYILVLSCKAENENSEIINLEKDNAYLPQPHEYR